MTAQLPSKTHSFSTVFLIEMWERFGFYGMQVLMVTYMIKNLGFDDARSNLVWGATSALIYATPAIGGWVGDKLLGTRRSMLIGASVLTLGYLLLWVPDNGSSLLYLALGVIIVGNGLFKSNAGNLVRKIYEGDDSRIDSAFTIYYMAVNLGSTFSMLLTPWIRVKVSSLYGETWGWHTGFGVCALGLILGLINYTVMRRSLAHIGSQADSHPVRKDYAAGVFAGSIGVVLASAFVLDHQAVARACVYAAGILILAVFAWLIARSERGERSGLVAALILCIQTIFFFIFYQQMSTSLNLFAQHNVDLSFDLFGFHLFNWIPEQFQSLNAIWIVLLSPVLVFIYNTLGSRGRDISVAAKFAWGFAAVAAGFFIYGLSARSAIHGQVSSWTMVWGYGLYSLGELLVSGLGLAMISRYVPERMSGFMMGAYFVASGISMYLGSIAANFAALPQGVMAPETSLPIYTSLFTKLGWVGVGCTVIALVMLPLMKRLSANHGASATPLPAVHSEEA